MAFCSSLAFLLVRVFRLVGAVSISRDLYTLYPHRSTPSTLRRSSASSSSFPVIFLSKHTAVSNRPALTAHPIGIPHLSEGEAGPQGGKPGWAAPPSPSIGPWLRHLRKLAQAHNMVPEFEITLEGTHHGPVTNTPTMFVEIGSTDEYWKRQDAAQVIALLVWEGLGLGGGAAVGNWNGEKDKNKILLGLGGGHYAPRHMDIVLNGKGKLKERCYVAS
ncbi:D-aminoacyl-tRNA deacylase-like [Malus domestica]|uniref:D-aminoacyl-tRNA deacylase-like n=1 Tax=Malus domestica TaxID=3750 RepID=UPI003974A6F3